MSLGVTLVVRKARPTDAAARADIVRASYSEYNTEAFWLFLFQEVTLQGLVLGGAVLFIFCGVSVSACLLLLPAAAAVVAASVNIAHHALAEHQIQCMRKELVGFVVEMRGPLAASAEKCIASKPIIVYSDLNSDTGDSLTTNQDTGPYHSQVIGTASVCDWRGCSGVSCWVRAVGVRSGWRRAGAGRALCASARRWAAARGVAQLGATTSQLQHAARSLLHNQGWECRGWYHRPVCGGALTLLVAHLVLDLPAA